MPNRGNRPTTQGSREIFHENRRRRSVEPRGNERRSVSKDHEKFTERDKRPQNRDGNSRNRNFSPKNSGADQSNNSSKFFFITEIYYDS